MQYNFLQAIYANPIWRTTGYSTRLLKTYLIFARACTPLLRRDNDKYLQITLEMVNACFEAQIHTVEFSELLFEMCKKLKPEMSNFADQLKAYYDKMIQISDFTAAKFLIWSTLTVVFKKEF